MPDMNLDADGKKRLAAMKAALAAGLPLAGLLAGTAGCAGSDSPGTMGTFPNPDAVIEQPAPLKDEADATMGDVPPPEEQPAETPDDESGTIQKIPEEWVVDGFIGFVDEPQKPNPPHGDEAP